MAAGGRPLYVRIHESSPQPATAAAVGDPHEPGGGDSGSDYDPNVASESRASRFSRFTFGYINPLLARGSTRALADSDLPAIADADRVRPCADVFHRHWNDVLREHYHSPPAAATAAGIELSDRTIAAAPAPALTLTATSYRLLLRALWRTFRLEMALNWLLLIPGTGLSYVYPFVLNRLLEFLTASDTGSGGGADPTAGYVYVALLFALPVIGQLSVLRFGFVAMRISLRRKSGLRDLLYRKMLRISKTDAAAAATVAAAAPNSAPAVPAAAATPAPAPAPGVSIGLISNIMAVDCDKVTDFFDSLHQFVLLPVQLLVGVILLVRFIGWRSSLGALGVTLLLLPFNAVLARLGGRLHAACMRSKDHRTSLMDEILQTVRSIKLLCWESVFVTQLTAARTDELNRIFRKNSLVAFTRFWNESVPVVMTATVLVVYAISGGEMSAATVFTSLALLQLIQSPMAQLPTVLPALFEALASAQRITELLCAPEIDPAAVQSDVAFVTPQHAAKLFSPFVDATQPATASATTALASDSKLDVSVAATAGAASPLADPASRSLAVAILNASFAWPQSAAAIAGATASTLSSINLLVPSSGLVCVVGAVGAGKSSLLSALLAEIPRYSPAGGALGAVGVVAPRGVAYVPQTAWMRCATFRDNILFGRPYDADRYQRALHACALSVDVAVLPGGEMCQIGEKGINLSGGQKQRVSLARAVYADADVYLLDDPLSAVDSHTGRHLVEHCICGPPLKGKAVLLVTHQLHVLPRADWIVVLRAGRVVAAGTFAQLSALRVPEIGSAQHAVAASNSGVDEKVAVSAVSPVPTAASPAAAEVSSPPPPSSVAAGQLISTETELVGSIPSATLHSYRRALGAYSYWIVGWCLCQYAMSFIRNYWLSLWTNDSASLNHSVRYYIGAFLVLALVACVALLIFQLSLSYAGYATGKWYHDEAVRGVMRAPIRWFDATPVGRVLSRFTTDQDTVDEDLHFSLAVLLVAVCGVLSVLAVISFVTPYFATLILPIGWFYYTTQRLYRPTSRQLNRLRSVSKSPVVSHLNESWGGLESIRAYKVQPLFIRMNEQRMESNIQILVLMQSLTNWLELRLQFVGTVVTSAAALFAVVSRGSVSAGAAGLSLAYASSLTGALQSLIHQITWVETEFNAVERLSQYAALPPEEQAEEAAASLTSAGAATQFGGFCARGFIEFDAVSMRYRPELPLVLRGDSVMFTPGMRVGVCGRTGSGKSSLIAALLRVMPLAGGVIRIDGVDISSVPLRTLRSRIALISQDPVLWRGSIRFNLDALHQYSDQQIWSVLGSVQLTEFVRGLSGGLNAAVHEHGANLSAGQRQLLSLARALLRKCAIVVMDECTASVDLATDELIQHRLYELCGTATVITIAHRLNTIIRSDRILVLDAGRFVEFDSPHALLQRSGSVFGALVDETGPKNSALLRAAAVDRDASASLGDAKRN